MAYYLSCSGGTNTTTKFARYSYRRMLAATSDGLPGAQMEWIQLPLPNKVIIVTQEEGLQLTLQTFFIFTVLAYVIWRSFCT